MCLHVGTATRDTIRVTIRTTIADHRAPLECSMKCIRLRARPDAVPHLVVAHVMIRSGHVMWKSQVNYLHDEHLLVMPQYITASDVELI